MNRVASVMGLNLVTDETHHYCRRPPTYPGPHVPGPHTYFDMYFRKKNTPGYSTEGFSVAGGYLFLAPVPRLSGGFNHITALWLVEGVSRLSRIAEQRRARTEFEKGHVPIYMDMQHLSSHL